MTETRLENFSVDVKLIKRQNGNLKKIIIGIRNSVVDFNCVLDTNDQRIGEV